MRQLQKLSERGSANWPFIITLILLLAFGYMWFDERDRRENAEAEEKKSSLESKATRDAAVKFMEFADQLSAIVGYNEVPAKSLVPTGTDEQAKEAARVGNTIAGSRVITDLTKLRAQLTPDGTQDGQPGLLNFLINEAQAEMVQAMRSASNEAVTETEVQFDWMTDEFKRKLGEVRSLQDNVPTPPKKPVDADDAAEQARYEEELKAYEEAVARYEQAINELNQMEGAERWESVIKPPKGFADETQKVILLDFFNQALSGQVTVETLLGYPKNVIPVIIAELKSNKEADAGIIAQVRGDAATKQAELDQTQADLQAEQTRRTQEQQQLSGELAVANETAESNRLEATNALQRVQVVEEEMRRAIAEREARISALENRIRIDKEKRDLKARIDSEDGRVLAASPTMGTAIINLGSKDKVYPGLKFNVSYMGRGDIRRPKGQIEVTRVLGPKSAKVAIITQLPGNPVTEGDIVHNPLWSNTDTIHIWLAGELEKYPIEIARDRLSRMGVIIDKQITGSTDYVVIPNSMAAPVAAAASDDDEEDEDEGAVGGQSEYEKIHALARTFGATVITEKMLNQFLGF